MKLNIGCGTKHRQGFTNIDIQKPADHIMRLGRDDFPKDWKNKVVRIEADNLLEHLDNDEFMKAMNDCWEVMKKGGTFWFRVPNALDWMDGAFGDPTHKRFFVPRSFKYFIDDNPTYRNYGKAYGFKPWKKESLKSDGKFFICQLTPNK